MVALFPTLDIPDGLLIDVAQFQTTDRPTEDRFSVDFDKEKSRLILGVYDGHGGSETADFVSNALPSRLLKHSPDVHEHELQFRGLDQEILRKFQRDHSLFRKRSPDWIDNARKVRSGSAALIFDIDLESLSAVYANAGDCRLIICQSNSEPGHLLQETKDLNVKAVSERERLAQEHPGEDQMIVGNRLFGKLMCTRGFGDGYYKLPRGPFGKMHRKYIDALSNIEQPGKVPMNEQYVSYFYAYKTPPYITASPECGSFQLERFQLERGNIVILASDGLWDLISSEDAARLVVDAAAERRGDLAKLLLKKVRNIASPGDDITIVTFVV